MKKWVETALIFIISIPYSEGERKLIIWYQELLMKFPVNCNMTHSIISWAASVFKHSGCVGGMVIKEF